MSQRPIHQVSVKYVRRSPMQTTIACLSELAQRTAAALVRSVGSRTHRTWRHRTAGADYRYERHTIRRGRRELAAGMAGRPTEGCASRAVGGHRWKKKL